MVDIPKNNGNPNGDSLRNFKEVLEEAPYKMKLVGHLPLISQTI